MIRSLCLVVLLVFSSIAQASAEPSAEALLSQLQRDYHKNSFEMSMVHILQNNIDSFRLIHGWSNKTEIAHLMSLDGRPMEYLAKNQQVTFADNGENAYTLNGSRFPGLLFSFFGRSPEQLSRYYDVISAGKSRVAGRVTQGVRLVSKQDDKYSFNLWLDEESGILLRLDVSDKSGHLVEQYLGIHFKLLPSTADTFKQLVALKVPAVIQQKDVYHPSPDSHRWSLGWVPLGFQVLSEDQHTLFGGSDKVDYFLLSDGLVDVSVYVSAAPTDAPSKEQFAIYGATAVFNLNRDDGYTLTAVGELPVSTLRHMTQTMQMNASSGAKP